MISVTAMDYVWGNKRHMCVLERISCADTLKVQRPFIGAFLCVFMCLFTPH